MKSRRSKYRPKKEAVKDQESGRRRDVVTYDNFGTDETIYVESYTGSSYRSYNENVGVENSCGRRQIIGAVNAWD